MHKDAIYLVDGTSICYRSFFAIKLSTSKGVPSGAVYGFFKTLQKIISKYNPSYMVICFDVSRKTFRHDKFKEYKINRPPLPDALGMQLPLIKKMIKDLGITVVEKEGFEADDIIAALSEKAQKQGAPAVIVTMDKDMYQLIKKEEVVVYNPNQDRILKEADFLKEYGFSPPQMVDFLSLAGDSTDNIPGAKGIGKVGAAKLIKEFGTIERLFDNLDKLSPKVKNTLLENKKIVFLSKDLVKLHLCDLNVKWDNLKIGTPDYAEIYKLFSELEFKSLLKDVQSPSPDLDIEVKEKQDLDFLQEERGQKRAIFIDESYGYIFDKKKNCVYKLKLGQLRKFLEEEKAEKISYGFKEQMLSLKDAQIRGIYFDVKLAAYLVDPTFADYELSTLIFHYLEEVLPQVSAVAAPLFIWRLYEKLSSKLKEEKIDKLFFEVEMPLIYVLADMQRQGLKVDIEVMSRLFNEVDQRIEKAGKEIFKLAGKEFNLNSHQQLAGVLFKDLKIPPQGKTKTGFSTAEGTLRKLASNYPIVQVILEYRQLNKLKTTYILPLIEEVKHKGGWLHASFNQTATATGRLSSSSPNLQSIPVRGEFSSYLRKAFIPSFKGGCLLSADYSQIELRILAHFSQDAKLVEGFKKDLDIHTFTASLLFNIGEADVSDKQRDLAKKVNFGIIYGMGKYRLSQELAIKPKEAEQFIDEYFLRYPKVAEYINRVHSQLEKHGFVKTILGRKRSLPHFDSSNVQLQEFSRRQAINTPIQGSCADIIKVAMVKIYAEMKSRKLKSHLIMQIHDELIFDVAGTELDEVTDIVKRNMEESIKLEVPIKVNLKVGKNWAQMKEVNIQKRR
ncbi:MAG: DNA polymerase I [Candidatus Omnitrophota bacterium]|nr:MAG: DNA polymerase I [Candidatus Omnitrophota bacterium]